MRGARGDHEAERREASVEREHMLERRSGRAPSSLLSEIKHGGLYELRALGHLSERVQAALGALPQRVDLSWEVWMPGVSGIAQAQGRKEGHSDPDWEELLDASVTSRTRPSSNTEPSGSASNAETSSEVRRSPRLAKVTRGV